MRTASSNSIARARAWSAHAAVGGERFGDLSPTRITGFSAVMGSWKINEIRPPRTARISRSLSRAGPGLRT